MYLIVGFKNLDGDISKLEINRSEDLSEISIGQYLLLRDGEMAHPVCGLINELKSDSISLLIPGKYQKQLLNWSVGEKLYAVDGPYGASFTFPREKLVVCLAEEESALFIYPIVKALYKNGNTVITLFSNVDSHFLFADEIRKMSSEFYQLNIDRTLMINNTVTPFLRDLLKDVHVSELYTIGNSTLVKEVLQYTARKPALDANIILNTLIDFDGCLHNLFTVSLSRRSKFITVDGTNFRSVYQNVEQFVQRFPSTKGNSINQELHSEEMVFHK